MKLNKCKHEIWILILMIVMVIVGIVILYQSLNIGYYLYNKTISIIICIALIMIGVYGLYYFWSNLQKRKNRMTILNKVILFLIAFVCVNLIFVPCKYLLYLNDVNILKDKYTNLEYINDEVSELMSDRNMYESIYNRYKQFTVIDTVMYRIDKYSDDMYYTLLSTDTLMFDLIRKPSPYGVTRVTSKEEIDRLRNGSIRLHIEEQESIMLISHYPSLMHSKEIKSAIMNKSSISSVYIKQSIKDNLIFYKDMTNKIDEAIEDVGKRGISLFHFLIYTIDKPGETKNNLLMNTVVMFSIFVNTFIIGYIFNLLYKKLDEY